ncbi:UDP-N-acetylmuramoyl-L-alanyl-D-glutamate--2,6-diaminopimelate ligase [Phytohabitans aurantiacus]|jgi:UDP-N-acetylmuramoyl-L-alanyl-D-glutamate--2,6-diaminopimelate ligase|uniref:UDP-N-acetylmuramyl-tripeptide synthetase n=1 Tax=Phytohabitans aurantiacus TaxID=3016789 RepID=A0ABQ5QY38_9ACTN|nr:UDP-N-acetylmuramoyl-L-alanyl-D-glutamate--2,6-diaminopimelate ligase [Phytohabitans aurantiacus]GLH99448.1 UDP-N-acetylmuramoyl-L-alanyl-D-glutamate--2,6-diaminopimelate ligase [Phytohabitans aurantiacus]
MRQISNVEQVLAAVATARLVQGDARRLVTGITHDSRRVGPGDLFVAIAGERHDARRFVDDALARGAVGVVTEGEVETPRDTVVVRVPSARAALADLAAAVYGHPAKALRLVGVTGTDGKTTTTHMIHAALEAGGLRTGRLSTLGMTTGNGVAPAHYGFTTPEAGDLHRMLADMVDAGCDAAVTEVSSHALSLERVRGVAFAAGVFTNLSPEHLDFHGSMEEYLATKARLFAMVAESTPDGVGVVNADDAASAVMRASGPQRILSYGIESPADVTARDIRLEPGKSRFTLVTPWGQAEVVSAMPGMMNVANWLAAATTALSMGVSLDAVVAAAAGTTVDGRLQSIDCGQPFQVLVDFAHTPKALETVLRTVRSSTKGRLMVLFGHSGGRDAENRRPMGKIAAELADVMMVTSDNPQHEDPAEIAAEIVAGAREAGTTCDVQVRLDRGQALRALIARAEPGDTILLAGKGHEEYQVLSHGKVLWNDAEQSRQVLAEQGWGCPGAQGGQPLDHVHGAGIRCGQA